MSILEEILEVKKEEVKKLKSIYSLSSFSSFEFFSAECLSLKQKLKSNNYISIIAEIKKASPSKGIIRENFSHLKIAEEYFTAGADTVSVLTDEKFFCGNISFLSDIAKIKEVPLLRKDFIINEYQVYEAKANGADLILLISEALSENQIKELTHAAYELGMEVLLEMHSGSQLEKIELTLNNLIGINNRNLNDFSVSLDTTALLTEKILLNNENVNIISESGIQKKEDIEFLKNHRVNGILVGEHLMRSADIKGRLEELKEWCLYES